MSSPTQRRPRIRRAPIPSDARVVVRGEDGDRTVSMRQAQRFLRLFPDWGRYGLSAYYARDETDVDDLARDQLERFSHMAIFDLVQLEDGGFEVVPTFRTPHVTIAFAGDLQKRLDHLGALVKEHLRNPYHEQEPAAPSDEDEDDER